jgi:hypothetical protein
MSFIMIRARHFPVDHPHPAPDNTPVHASPEQGINGAVNFVRRGISDLILFRLGETSFQVTCTEWGTTLVLTRHGYRALPQLLLTLRTSRCLRPQVSCSSVAVIPERLGMKVTRNLLQDFLRGESAAGIVEYALLAALLVLAGSLRSASPGSAHRARLQPGRPQFLTGSGSP